MKKALVVASVGVFLGFERNDIRILQSLGYTVDCAANFNQYRGAIDDLSVKKIHIPFERSPFDKQNRKAYVELKKIISTGNYTILHCHTPVGGVLARLASRKLRKQGELKVIYTAHGFHFYNGAPLINWILFYPIEKWLSRYTDVLITINKEDYQRAKKRFKMKHLEYVPGIGINTDGINKSISCRTDLIDLIKINNKSKLLLSVGELSDRKNHKMVIQSLIKLPNDFHYLIVGDGGKEDELRKLAAKVKVLDRVHFLGYRNDVFNIMKSCDIFVFPSKQEGLPVALMEAIACGLPCVASNIRGNSDLINYANSVMLFDLNDSEKMIEYIKCISNYDKVNNNNDNITKLSETNIIKVMNNIYAGVKRNDKKNSTHY